MRSALVGIAFLTAFGAARAQGAIPVVCMPPSEMREVVANEKVVAPAAAVMTARRAVPGADVVRANLCRGEQGLVYVIGALRRDGRLLQVTIDAPTGKGSSVR